MESFRYSTSQRRASSVFPFIWQKITDKWEKSTETNSQHFLTFLFSRPCDERNPTCVVLDANSAGPTNGHDFELKPTTVNFTANLRKSPVKNEFCRKKILRKPMESVVIALTFLRLACFPSNYRQKTIDSLASGVIIYLRFFFYERQPPALRFPVAKKYLLSCLCGESFPVEITQSGQTVTCRCGKAQQAPTLLKMKKLPVAGEGAPPDVTATPTFNARFFFCFLGAIVLVPSLIFLFWVVSTHPHPADVVRKQVWFTYGSNWVVQDSIPLSRLEQDILNFPSDHIEFLPPFQTYTHFRTLKDGPVLSHNFQENYEMIKDAHRIRVSAAAICVGLGLLSLVVSLFMPKQTRTVGVRKGAEWT